MEVLSFAIRIPNNGYVQICKLTACISPHRPATRCGSLLFPFDDDAVPIHRRIKCADIWKRAKIITAYSKTTSTHTHARARLHTLQANIQHENIRKSLLMRGAKKKAYVAFNRKHIYFRFLWRWAFNLIFKSSKHSQTIPTKTKKACGGRVSFFFASSPVNTCSVCVCLCEYTNVLVHLTAFLYTYMCERVYCTFLGQPKIQPELVRAISCNKFDTWAKFMILIWMNNSTI